jgi:hypothetical protein
VTNEVTVPHGAAAMWDAPAVRDVLVEILRAIGHAGDPEGTDRRGVILQGFSWIVEPVADGVVIAIEIPMGAAVAGPFAVGREQLDALITEVLKAGSQLAGSVSTVPGSAARVWCVSGWALSRGVAGFAMLVASTFSASPNPSRATLPDVRRY